jgi:ribosomal protein S18 acetylase RimI-like enzyme
LLVLGRKACGVSKATLRVYKDNEPAIRLYRTLGFTAVPEQSSDSVVLMSRPA